MNSQEQKFKPFVLVRIVIVSFSFQTKRIFDSSYFEKKVPSNGKEVLLIEALSQNGIRRMYKPEVICVAN